MKTSIRILAAVAICLSSASAAPIISATFVSTGSRQSLNGTQVDLTSNDPGSSWVWGGGYDWAGSPFVSATWDPPGIPVNIADLSNENTALGLSLSSAGGYTKPTKFTVSANLRTTVVSTLGGSGLGTWSAMPARTNGALSITGFTGILMKPTAGNGTLQLVENGALVGSAYNVGFALTTAFYGLTYTVDTSSGAISDVVFNGSSISAFSSTAFTDSATSFVGVMSGNAGRTSLNSFSVTAVPEPSTWALLLGGGLVLGFLRYTRRSLAKK